MTNVLLNELEPYLPSSSEKKQAVMMYMVVGLVLSLGKWEVSPYTHHHLKQSLGWFVFLMLVVFMDLALIILGIIFSFFLWLVVLITIPALVVGAMGIYQAQQGKYIWEKEVINKFFLFFSGIGNWILNLFDANHYQIIDGERYRSEEQFYAKSDSKDKEKKDDQDNNTEDVDNGNANIDALNLQNHEINNESIDRKNLDKDQQIPISKQDIGIDLSDHEINDSGEFKLEL